MNKTQLLIGFALSSVVVPAAAYVPLPVPAEPPIGNSSSVPVCAPPPVVAANPTYAVEQAPQPVSKPAVRHWKDPKATILMNTAPGNLMLSLVKRVGYPDSFDNAISTDFYNTLDGVIAVKSTNGDRVISITLIQ